MRHRSKNGKLNEPRESESGKRRVTINLTGGKVSIHVDGKTREMAMVEATNTVQIRSRSDGSTQISTIIGAYLNEQDQCTYVIQYPDQRVKGVSENELRIHNPECQFLLIDDQKKSAASQEKANGTAKGLMAWAREGLRRTTERK